MDGVNGVDYFVYLNRGVHQFIGHRLYLKISNPFLNTNILRTITTLQFTFLEQIGICLCLVLGYLASKVWTGVKTIQIEILLDLKRENFLSDVVKEGKINTCKDFRILCTVRI